MEANTEKVRITLDGRECWADNGLTILDAARQNDIHIPTLCHHPAVSAWGGCRLCVVEVDGSPRLAASCVTPVRDGMEVVTTNERIIQSRRLVLEFLFAERNHNCMICARSGDCELQDLAYELQMDHLSVFNAFDQFPVDITNEYMGLDHNRCILCGRCVRGCTEITGARVLDFINRGPGTLISFDLNETRENSTCFQCGVCMEMCPTGAIYSRLRTHSAVRGHSKAAWTQTNSVCPMCGMLCPVTATVSGNTLLKVHSGHLGDADRPDRGQLCRRGRFEVLGTRGERLIHPMIRDVSGQWVKTGWEKALGTVAEKLHYAKQTYGGEAVFGLTSAMCANEELLLFKSLMKQGWNAGYVDTFDGDAWRSLLHAWEKTALEGRETSLESVAKADVILVIGAETFASHPIVPAMIHKRVLDGQVKVVAVGEGDFQLPQIHYHLSVSDADIAATVRAILYKTVNLRLDQISAPELERFRITEGDADTARILTQQGLDAERLTDFEEGVSTFAGAEKPLVLAGVQLSGDLNAAYLKDAIRLAFAKNSGAGSLPLGVLKPFGNSAAAWKLGLAASKAPAARAGWKAGLVLAADGEVPNQAIVDNLDSLEFLAVFSPFVPDGALGQKADVMLPCPAWMEQDGTYTSNDGRRVRHKERILAPPDSVMDTAAALGRLAQKAGIALEYESPADWRREARMQIADE